MIARIKGKITEIRQNSVLLDVGGISYEIFLPQTVMQRLTQDICSNKEISLITYHYVQVEPTKSTPVLIGFLNEVEKEFFQAFISVSGIGPRAALRALNQPISLIARAIDEADADFLRSLPGIGQQKARDIIAKLQNKVGKFGLLKDQDAASALKSAKTDIIDEATLILTQLEYKKSEAESMIKNALARGVDITTTEALLNEVYKQKKTE